MNSVFWTGAASFYGTAAMLGERGVGGGASIRFPSAPPVALALSADGGELLITAHIPSAMLKRMIGIVSGGGEEEGEEDEDGAPATRPAAGGNLRVPRGRVAEDSVTVERRTVVESMPATGPKED